MLSFLLLLHPILIYSKNTCITYPASEASSKPSQNKAIGSKTSWAIIALIRPSKSMDLDMRNTILIKKIKPYANLHNITIIFFSEMIFPSQSLINWRKQFKEVANVRLINTAQNGYNSEERFGYKYMCKFFALDVYQYLKNEYEYYMRIDTDCYIDDMEYDIFQWAKDKNVEYGYSMRKLEAHKPTRKTLPDWTEKYATKCNLKVMKIYVFIYIHIYVSVCKHIYA
jgi:hypothetical protein